MTKSHFVGNAWIFTCIKQGSYFLIGSVVGKRDHKTCLAMIEKMSSRLELPSPTNKINIFTDGYEEYERCLAKYYNETCINYGQIIKIRKCGKIVDKIKTCCLG